MTNKMREFTSDFRFILWVVLFAFLFSLFLGSEITIYLMMLVFASMVVINADKVKELMNG